ncbi:MAG: response regulator [Magnetospirillum sp.]|nr:response regulator [Magnetospirillum sp.]
MNRGGTLARSLSLALFLVPLVGISALNYWSDYKAERRLAEDVGGAVARAAEKNIGNALRTVDLLLQYVGDYALEGGPGRDTLQQTLALQAASMPEIDVLLVADAEGRRRTASSESDRRFADVSRFDFFRAQQAIWAERNVVIDGPMPLELGRRIVVSRPIIDRDNRFRGIAAAVLKPDFFSAPLAQVAPERIDTIVLTNTFGVVLSHYPDQPSRLGTTLGSSAGQIVTWRVIERYPLVVGAGIAVATVDAAFWHTAGPKLALEGGLVLLLAMLAVLLHNRQRQLVRSAGALGSLNLELEDRVAERTRAAEDASQAKSRFLAMASHDLRQPVQALNLYANVLSGKVAEGDPAAIVERMRGSAAALADLLDALLDVSKLDARVVHPAVRPFPLGAVMERIWQHFEPMGEAAQVSLSVVTTRLWVESDPALVERVVQNLAANALRYTPAGGKVVIGVRRRGRSSLALQVWDSGIGIPEDQRELIFAEFTRLDSGNREGRHGLGLGLAIVRRLVDLLGHALSLRSTVGRGSVFELVLPLAAPCATCAPVAAPAPFRAGAVVLVIEDDPDIRDALARQLRAWELEVVAADGEVAALAACANHAVDAVVADLSLGVGGNGLEVARMLRRQVGRCLPVVMLTGDTGPERLREAMETGLRLLHKPAEPEALRAALQAEMAAQSEPVAPS